MPKNQFIDVFTYYAGTWLFHDFGREDSWTFEEHEVDRRPASLFSIVLRQCWIEFGSSEEVSVRCFPYSWPNIVCLFLSLWGRSSMLMEDEILNVELFVLFAGLAVVLERCGSDTWPRWNCVLSSFISFELVDWLIEIFCPVLHSAYFKVF